MPLSLPQTRIAFGLFEADLVSGELWKSGFRVKLQSQPFRVLTLLLERPGEVISREELQQRLWGKETTVDYDHSLGTAVNKIREALGDSADNPRFVETLARRGYRFIAPVRLVGTDGGVVGGGADGAPEASVTPVLLEADADGTTTVISRGSAAGAGSTDPGPAEPAAAMPAGAAIEVVVPGGIERAPTERRRRRLLAGLGVGLGAGVGLLAVAAVAFFAGSRTQTAGPYAIRQVTHGGQIMAAYDGMESFPATLTDGVHLYTSTLEEGRPSLAAAALVGGTVQSLPIPDEVAGPVLAGISPDGSRLLVRNHLTNESEQPLWVVPVGGGSAQRLTGVLAHDATWMPDGRSVLYAAGNELALVSLEDGGLQPFAKLPGRAFWLRWSPDGQRLRFTLFDPLAHTQALWELPMTAKGSGPGAARVPHPLLAGWNTPADECCGVWTADGGSYIFRSIQDGQSDLWRLRGANSSRPERLTDGPVNYENPVAARSGQRIFFTGADMQSEMEIYHPEVHEFRPAHAFFSDAHRLAFSRDGGWVAWVDTQERLWRARADGSEKLQLTPDSMQVFLAQWSPDASRLALMAREPGRAWQIYQVLADGSALENVLRESRNAGDPTWSPDGHLIAFGRVPDLMGKESGSRTIQVADLRSRQVRTLPGSEGLFSPRWSPDGRYIAAISFNQHRLMLFNTATERWAPLVERSVADPVWSSDGRSIYAQGFVDARKAIYRVSVPEGRVEEVAGVGDLHLNSVVDYFFCGLLADNTPVVRVQIATGNIYSLDLARMN